MFLYDHSFRETAQEVIVNLLLEPFFHFAIAISSWLLLTFLFSTQ